MNRHPAGRDPWVVIIGKTYVFGPFEGQEEAVRWRNDNGGRDFPLFGLDEEDALTDEPWVDQARASALVGQTK